jgi:uncharacterized protein (DUF952 family)
MNNKDFIVHICPSHSWEEAQVPGEYRVPSLETEGFIHCSKPDQILTVANNFYQETPDLVILWIDPQKVKNEIKYEPGSDNTNEVFPHIYGPLNIDAVLGVYDFRPASDGVFKDVLGAKQILKS